MKLQNYTETISIIQTVFRYETDMECNYRLNYFAMGNTLLFG